METNMLPNDDASVNTTKCCPRCNPDGRDAQELQFRGKRFLRATTRSVMHVPSQNRRVFEPVDRNVSASGGWDMGDRIVFSRDLSAWQAEHLFAVPRDIPDEEMTTLTADFITHVVEGPYRQVRDWHAQMEGIASARAHNPRTVWFLYTTCAKCAKVYGRNDVVGMVEI